MSLKLIPETSQGLVYSTPGSWLQCRAPLRTGGSPPAGALVASDQGRSSVYMAGWLLQDFSQETCQKPRHGWEQSLIPGDTLPAV